MDKFSQGYSHLSYSQIPVPTKEIFGIPCNSKLCVSTNLRPAAKLLSDIGLRLVQDQYSDEHSESHEKQPEPGKPRKKLRRKSVDESSSVSRSGSDTESETSSNEVSTVWKYDEDNFPVLEKKAKFSCDVTDNEAVEQSVMQDCIERLRWEKCLPYRCPTCPFASQSVLVLNMHFQEGHSWVSHSFPKLGGITCAFKHRKRVIARSYTEFYNHMLECHDIKVSMRNLALSTPPCTLDCSRCFYSTTVRTFYFNHCLSCPEYLCRNVLRPDISDLTCLFTFDGSNNNILRGTLVKITPFQEAKTKVVEDARRLLDNRSTSTVTTSSLRMRAASEMHPTNHSLTVRSSNLRTTNPNILRKAPSQTPVLMGMLHPRNEAVDQNQSNKFPTMVDKDTSVDAFENVQDKPWQREECMTNENHNVNYVCELCNGSTVGMKALLKHFHFRHGVTINPFRDSQKSCKDCGKKFWTNFGLTNHISHNGCEIGMRCPFCHRPFMKEVIYSHVAVTHPDQFNTMKAKGYCLLCDNDDDHPLDLERHWYEGHNLKMLTFQGEKEAMVRIFIPAGRSLNENGELTGENEEYACPKCPLMFPSRVQLRDHFIHSGHRLTCTMDSCNAKFTDRFTLISHLTVDHANEKRACRWCPGFFADTAVDLNKHLRQFHSPKDPVLKIHRITPDVPAVHS